MSAYMQRAALYAVTRPSGRLSHGWISQKWLILGLYNFHHTVAPSLLVFVG